MFPIPPWPPEGWSCSPRCLRPGYRGQHQSPQIELALVNPVADDLGRTRCTPSRVRNGPANHESTHDPEEAIGPRSETIVANVSTAAKSIFALSLFALTSQPFGSVRSEVVVRSVERDGAINLQQGL